MAVGLLAGLALVVADGSARAPAAEAGPGPAMGGSSGPRLRLPAPERSPEEARKAAEEILAGSEFQASEKPLVQRAMAWVQRQLTRLLNNLFSGGGGAAATWLIVAAVVGALVFLVRRLVRNVQPDPGVRMATSTAARRSPDEWRADALAHEAAGDWKEALRCRFRALVGDLVDRSALADVPGRTAGEYRTELGEANPAAAAPFAEATDLFERAWYADEPTGPTENTRFRALADAVLSAVRP